MKKYEEEEVFEPTTDASGYWSRLWRLLKRWERMKAKSFMEDLNKNRENIQLESSTVWKVR